MKKIMFARITFMLHKLVFINISFFDLVMSIIITYVHRYNHSLSWSMCNGNWPDFALHRIMTLVKLFPMAILSYSIGGSLYETPQHNSFCSLWFANGWLACIVLSVFVLTGYYIYLWFSTFIISQWGGSLR